MKRFRKALLALAVLSSVVIAGGLWVVDSALNVASDAVDSTFGDAPKAQVAAQKQVVAAAQSTQPHAQAAFVGTEPSLLSQARPAPAAPPISRVPEPTADKGKSGLPQRPVKQNQKDDEDSLADLGGLVNLFLNDGEDAHDPMTLLTSGDNETKGNTTGNKNTEDSLTDFIPGANSPTLQRWLDGKYKGKETQAVDDALDDPKLWRLIFFLNGGM